MQFHSRVGLQMKDFYEVPNKEDKASDDDSLGDSDRGLEVDSQDEVVSQQEADVDDDEQNEDESNDYNWLLDYIDKNNIQIPSGYENSMAWEWSQSGFILSVLAFVARLYQLIRRLTGRQRQRDDDELEAFHLENRNPNNRLRRV